MLRTRLFASVLTVIAIACAEPATAPLAVSDATPATALGDPPRKIRVTSGEDSGPGTLRAAMAEATADPAVVGITIGSEVGTYINVFSPLIFAGEQALTIDGNNVSLHGDASDGIFDVSVSSAVTFYRMWIIRSNGVGVKVNVPPTATGTVRVTFSMVGFIDHRRHAILVNDLPSYLEDEQTTSDAGSPASIRVEITGSHFGQNGREGWDWLEWRELPALRDQAAIRINEGGDGDVFVVMKNLQIVDSGSDAVAVDERGNGNADVRLESSQVSGNGNTTPDAPDDLDDGLNVRERGAGSLTVRVSGVIAGSNGSSAIDARESGSGDLNASFMLDTLIEHGGALISLIEDDGIAGGGNLVLDVSDVYLKTSGGLDANTLASIEVHENGDGMLDARVARHRIWHGTGAGILFRETGAGNLRASVRSGSIAVHDTFGIWFDENGAGDLAGTVAGGYVGDNAGAGIRAEQESTGTGMLSVSILNLVNNGGGMFAIPAGQVTLFYTPVQ